MSETVMTTDEVRMRAADMQQTASRIYMESEIPLVWEKAGCRVNLVGSLRMGLLATHRDIDLHVYSTNITEQSSFAIASQMSALPGVKEITCINGLHTDEHCMAWHVKYMSENGEEWKFDIIHIEEGTEYDGYFERMADRIQEVMTPHQHDLILRLKFETPEGETIHGVEYYEAVIADGVSSLTELRDWVAKHRKKTTDYWIP